MKATPEQMRRREAFKLRAFGEGDQYDSQAIRDIVMMVAPALDSNPRRIKQFINMFRLNAVIAAETGINERLELEQLGKFVAISLRWPRLLNYLEDDLDLLNDLQRSALDSKSTKESAKATVNYWRQRQALISLLRYGCVEERGKPFDIAKYTLENVDVKILLGSQPGFLPPNQSLRVHR